MVALVEHFVASGDLILPNSSPTDHSQYFAECFLGLDKTETAYSNTFLLHNLASFFTHFVLHPNNHSSLTVPNHSFLRWNDAESSEKLLNTVKEIKETNSLETVRNAHSDWKVWMKMMLMVVQGAESLSDLSILQSRCLRASLLSLQTKHQLRAIPPHTEENDRTVVSSDEIAPHIHHLPFNPDVSTNWMNVDTSLLSSTISTETSLPSPLLSSLDHRTSSTDSSFYTNQGPPTFETGDVYLNNGWPSISQTNKRVYLNFVCPIK